MDVGIIGFARSGKTTLYNALTGQHAETGGYSAGSEPNVAVVKVPDPRVERLTELFKAPKIVHATIKYIDVPGIETTEGRKSGTLEDSLIRAVANCDALMAVVCGFDRGGLPPKIDADLNDIQTELLLTDLAKVEQRIEKIEKSAGRQTPEVRKTLERELELLKKLKTTLDAEKPLRSLEFDADEEKILRAYQFMTVKPLLLVVNLGEGAIAEAHAVESKIQAAGLPAATAALACCAQSEMDIAQIEDPAERQEFLQSFGIAERAADRIIRVSYETLGLISFFTAGPTEVHAWTLRKGLPALKAAGRIHSDLERGFIRAEIIACDDLLRCGSLAAAKKEGVLRVEGKTYEIKDGDVIEIRFSV